MGPNTLMPKPFIASSAVRSAAPTRGSADTARYAAAFRHRRQPGAEVAVRSKADYWKVPVTEQVPETYLCPEYERRVPGTGYRG